MGEIMKKTKSILSLLPLMLATVLTFGQQVEKTLVKAFNLQGKQLVVLDLDGVVEVTPWENDIMRIQMQISMDGSGTVLKSMVRSGRYHLLSKANEDHFLVFAPKMKKGLNDNLNERIVFKIFVPDYVEVKVEDEVMSSNKNTGDDKL